MNETALEILREARGDWVNALRGWRSRLHTLEDRLAQSRMEVRKAEDMIAELTAAIGDDFKPEEKAVEAAPENKGLQVSEDKLFGSYEHYEIGPMTIHETKD